MYEHGYSEISDIAKVFWVLGKILNKIFKNLKKTFAVLTLFLVSHGSLQTKNANANLSQKIPGQGKRSFKWVMCLLYFLELYIHHKNQCSFSCKVCLLADF